jgi:hypothetical protein
VTYDGEDGGGVEARPCEGYEAQLAGLTRRGYRS